MSSTILEIYNGTVQRGVDPSTVVLKAAVRALHIPVMDILSEQELPFDADITVTLRLKETENPNGIQVNWRDLMIRFFPSLKENEFTVQMVSSILPKQEPHIEVQRHEVPASPAVVPDAALAAHPEHLESRPVQQATVQSPQPTSASAVSPPTPSPASTSSSLSAASSASASAAFGSCCNDARSGSKDSTGHSANSSAPSSRSTSDAGDDGGEYEALMTCTVDGHTYVKPMTVFHEDLACKKCTSTEHTLEEHCLLETRSQKMCIYGDSRCNYGLKCKWAHSNKEMREAKAKLASAPFCFGTGNMCYMWKKDRNHAENSGYLFFAGCGATDHVLATSRNCW
jgi:hypothetical protein